MILICKTNELKIASSAYTVTIYIQLYLPYSAFFPEQIRFVNDINFEMNKQSSIQQNQFNEAALLVRLRLSNRNRAATEIEHN